MDTLAFDAPPNAGQSNAGCAAFDASLIGARVSARPSLCVEWRELARLTDIVAQWSALAARALERNVFYEPAFALAAAPVFGRNVYVVLVWEDATRQRLIGFFPAMTEKRRYGLPLPILRGWTHPYSAA
jgi:hypothetical protein